MIKKFYEFVLEDNRQSVDSEKDFEPTEPVLQKLYYKKLKDLYDESIPKYKLVMDILKINYKLRKKKPNYTYFKDLLKLSESELTEFLRKFEKLEDEDWYLPEIVPNTKIK
jgi:hypothetical protein